MRRRSPICSASGPNRCAGSSLAAEGFGPRQPPDHLRERLKQAMHPLPVWYAPYGDEDAAFGYPVHALTQRPMDMYHSLGQPERLAAADQGAELSLYLPTKIWEAQGFEEGDWARVSSRAGDHRGAGGAYGGAERKHRLDLERHRQAQGGLGAGCPTRPRRRPGSCLNHLISELLPDKGRGCRTRTR
jgi:hypothetical protein